MKKYSVLLLYPETNGVETYFEWVEAEDSESAALLAKQLAANANDGNYHPAEFSLLGVFEGHIDMLLGCQDMA